MRTVRYNAASNDYVPASFSNLVDRFLNDSLAASGGSTYSFVPKVDIIESEKDFEIHVSVPGMNKEDFKIDLNENRLTISGDRKGLKEQENENRFRSIETQFGKFSRSFVLPENVDGNKINAKYINGILELVVPKDEKKILKTTIPVA